ncbi:uncharacterized protein OCT59_013444 [Rhizophagus irregularis]|uniref:uncharacterized protein n=1 Tax=Rhizophagus irregularis TaxID=588596 RepID=UPI00331A06E8|nr:hypothetical protein OCT59_013444 [Rhizophagus irregularis]
MICTGRLSFRILDDMIGTGKLSFRISDDMIGTGRLSFRILDDMIGIIFEFWVVDDIIRTIHNGIGETFRSRAGNGDSSMDREGTGACDDKYKHEIVVLL